MTLRSTLRDIVRHEDLNFLLTNRIPRRWATQFMGWFSRIEHPIVRHLSLRTWQLFTDLDLSDAKLTRFSSLHQWFTRELKVWSRPIDGDADVIVSPCDGIVGAHGRIEGTRLYQIKGFPYALGDLLGGADTAALEGGTFVTLRLTSAMYHRFHAPADCTVRRVRYIAGDTWNVNPIALKRVEALFCKNERATIELQLARGELPLVLVPVAAILVASLRFTFVAGDPRALGSEGVACGKRLSKGDEMGHFQHGSTIVVLAPPGFSLLDTICEGRTIRTGEALLRFPASGDQRVPATTRSADADERDTVRR